jgi:hypothetical protein
MKKQIDTVRYCVVVAIVAVVLAWLAWTLIV